MPRMLRTNVAYGFLILALGILATDVFKLMFLS